jgi:hypothetical protein
MKSQMAKSWDTISLWPLGSRAGNAGSVTGAMLGEYRESILICYVSAISGVGARLRPRWEVYDGTRYTVLTRGATLTATGPSSTILAVCGNQGRPAWTVGGTTPAISASFAILAKG